LLEWKDDEIKEREFLNNLLSSLQSHQENQNQNQNHEEMVDGGEMVENEIENQEEERKWIIDESDERLFLALEGPRFLR